MLSEASDRFHALATSSPGKNLSTHCRGGCVGPRALTGIQTPDHPAHSKSLCWQCYSASYKTIAGYKLTVWTVHEGGLKQATSLSWSFVLMTLSGLAHWYQSLITACFYPDIGDCRLLQIAGIYHIFQTLRSTISWKYYIIIIIIYLAFQRSTTVDIELVIR